MSLRLTKQQRDALEKIAKRDDRAVSWLVRRAIDEFIERDMIMHTRNTRKKYGD